MSEQELQEVARHVGHELAVHWQYYHLQDDVVELAKVSKLLIAVKQGKAHRFAGRSLDDIDLSGRSIFVVTVSTVPHQNLCIIIINICMVTQLFRYIFLSILF